MKHRKIQLLKEESARKDSYIEEYRNQIQALRDELDQVTDQRNHYRDSYMQTVNQSQVAGVVRRTPNMRMVRAEVNGMMLSAMLPDDDDAVIIWYREVVMPQLEGLPPNRRVSYEETVLVGREIND